MKLGKFKSDHELEEEGVRFDFDDGAYILVARAGNEKFTKALKKFQDTLKHIGRRSKLDEAQVDEAVCRAMAQTILLSMEGWRDAEGDFVGKGEIIPDTEEMRFRILAHKDYKDFRDMISQISTNPRNYSIDLEEDDEGKSEPSPNISSPGESMIPSSVD